MASKNAYIDDNKERRKFSKKVAVMRRIANKRKVKNLICYLLAGLIPFMLAVAAYIRITDIMFDEALSAHIAQLQHKQELMDSFLFNVRSIGYAITNDDAVDAIASLEHISGADTSLLRDAAEMTIGNTLFDPVQRQVLCGYYVLFSDSRVILNLSSKSAFLTDTWQSDFSIDGLNARQWYELIFSEQGKAGFIPSATLSVNNVRRDVALYVQPISNGSGTPTAMAAIAVNMARLAELMLPSAAVEGETICLMDSAGGCLYPAGDIGDALKLLSIQMADGESASIDLDGQDTVVMLTRSVYTNWSLLWALPSRAIASASERLQLFVSLSSAAIILFAISITIMAAYFNNKPIREISRMLFASKKTADSGACQKAAHSSDPDDVSGGVKQLISLTQSIQLNLNEYRERLGEAMLDQLLEGRIQKEEEIRECGLLLGGIFSHRCYAVLRLRIGETKPYAAGEDVESIYMQRMVVLHQLIRFKNERIHAVNTDEIAVIYFSDDDPEEEQCIVEQLRNRAGDILACLQKMGHFNIRIGIGGICGQPSGIYRSAQQAQTALFMAKQNEQIILYDRKNHESADAYYYPLEEERRLINMVRSGNPSEALCILDGIYAENYEKRSLNSAILDQLHMEMQGTLTKLTSSIPPSVLGEPDECNAPMPDPYPNPAFNRLCEEIIGLCNRFAQVRHTCSETQAQRIVEYLETVYMDENISLNIVAERFHLSEAYLSRIFKEQTGENFTACLERIRLNHAQRLLTQTRIPIHEIVHRVGYVYDDTFRKAFKRFHGISPGEYRLLADTQPEKTG